MNILSNLSYLCSLSLFSFLSNFFIIILIKKNFFGSRINNKIDKLLNIKFFNLYYFIFIYLLILLVKFYFAKNAIYLDSNTIKVSANLGTFEAVISWEDLKSILSGYSDAAIFTVSAKIGQALAAKHAGMNLGTKIGIALATGAGGVISYNLTKLSSDKLTGLDPNTINGSLKVSGTLNLEGINVIASGNFPQKSEHPVLTYLFGINPNPSFASKNILFERISYGNNSELITVVNKSETLTALNNFNPNWRFRFTPSSPLEEGNQLLNILIDTLTNYLVLNIISIYLLFILSIILICKFILNNNFEFKLLSKLYIFNWPLGQKIANLINFYFTFWKKSSKIWVFSIIIALICFNSASIYSLLILVKVLKKLL